MELLQNEADQAREASVPGRVVIELRPEGLIVANTGSAFSVGGVASLQTAHLSPKRRNRRQFIGNKGLGFRSILNSTKNYMVAGSEPLTLDAMNIGVVMPILAGVPGVLKVAGPRAGLHRSWPCGRWIPQSGI